jgi:beta-glucanase (GH16 family)
MEFQAPLPSPPTGSTEWCLTWHDEFTGSEVDLTKWNVLDGITRGGSTWVAANTTIDGSGHLVLTANNVAGRQTTGAVHSKNKFAQRYGYFEIRCMLPTVPGHRVGFWLQARGTTQSKNGRDGTEIDIFEQVSRGPHVTHNLHWSGYGADHKQWGTRASLQSAAGWHTFALKWTPTEYQFYVDGILTSTSMEGGVSQVPEFIEITDVALEGYRQISDKFVVDYVRVYTAR